MVEATQQVEIKNKPCKDNKWSRAPQGVEPRSGKTRSTNTSALVWVLLSFTGLNILELFDMFFFPTLSLVKLSYLILFDDLQKNSVGPVRVPVVTCVTLSELQTCKGPFG